MTEYIKREDVHKMLETAQIISDGEYCGYCTEDVDISAIPAADVVEHRYGEWIEHEWAEEENGLLISNFECSACHEWERKTSDFCPNCGADMRKKG